MHVLLVKQLDSMVSVLTVLPSRERVRCNAALPSAVSLISNGTREVSKDATAGSLRKRLGCYEHNNNTNHLTSSDATINAIFTQCEALKVAISQRNFERKSGRLKLLRKNLLIILKIF